MASQTAQGPNQRPENDPELLEAEVEVLMHDEFLVY
jgi:hypothetical protein